MGAACGSADEVVVRLHLLREVGVVPDLRAHFRVRDVLHLDLVQAVLLQPEHRLVVLLVALVQSLAAAKGFLCVFRAFEVTSDSVLMFSSASGVWGML